MTLPSEATPPQMKRLAEQSVARASIASVLLDILERGASAEELELLRIPRPLQLIAAYWLLTKISLTPEETTDVLMTLRKMARPKPPSLLASLFDRAFRSLVDLETLRKKPPLRPLMVVQPQAARDEAEPMPPFAKAKEQAVYDFERRYMRALLASAMGNISAAARKAGLDRSNFRRILKKHPEFLEEAAEI